MVLARPTKWRRIERVPAVSFFIPSEKETGSMPENILKLEELEATRLKDLEGLEQSECAANMGVSRPTFQRILLAAREKIADSLVNAKTIRIQGGNFALSNCPLQCRDCGHEWNERFENVKTLQAGGLRCAACGSDNIRCVQSCEGKFCRGHCRRHGRRRR
jgi:predicted DNA-binding protein (UPF0251 family)